MSYLSASSDTHYDRFTSRQKKVITAVISLAGIIGPFAASSFIPSIQEIARELMTSGTVVNYTVGAYVLTLALGNLVWAPYAEFYGRRPVYLISLPLVCAGALASAMARTVLELVIGRCLQAFGASCVLAVGAATISDIYKLEERGTAMGIFFGAILFGPPLAPLIGGLLATYYSWRLTQLCIMVLGLCAFVAIYTLLPETSHPGTRGIDKIEQIELKAVSKEDLESLTTREKIVASGRTQNRNKWLNPFKSLNLFRGPVVLLVATSASLALTTFYFFAVPLGFTLAPQYGIMSPAYIGACFVPSGFGSMVGAMVAGRLSDRAIIKGRRGRQGKWSPEDRLKAAIPGAIFFLPLSLIVYGYALVNIEGTKGLAICLICLFINGMGVDIILSPVATYLCDILKTRSVEAMAVYTASRSLFCAIVSAGVLPMVYSVGIFSTYLFAAVLAVVAYGLLMITIVYGHELRRWNDIGYTPSNGIGEMP